VIQYQIEHPGEEIVLYTHDVGPRLTSRRLGLTARELPEADRLPPQKDDTERENERLRRELHQLQAAAPILHITLNGRADVIDVQPIGRVPTSLTDQEVDAMASAARAQLPTIRREEWPEPESIARRINGKLAIDLGKRVAVIPNAIYSSEYDRYERECAQYEHEYRKYLLDRYEAEEVCSRIVAIAIELHNTGGKPAEDINVTVTLPNDVQVDEYPRGFHSPPPAPVAPRTQQDIFAESMQHALKIDGFTPSFDAFQHLNASTRGPSFDGQTVSWWVRALKHGFLSELGDNLCHYRCATKAVCR